MFSNNETTIPPNSPNDTIPKSIFHTLSPATSLDTSVQHSDDIVPHLVIYPIITHSRMTITKPNPKYARLTNYSFQKRFKDT